MLQSIRIKNLALLEEVSLDFEPGFTAVTGETGAGKSILLGALSLLAGERADKTLIRQGASSCEVEAALFFKSAKQINTLLASLDLPECDDGLLILKRSLAREKAPKITVNGGLASLSTLQQLGEAWIDFHGPSEPRRLLKENCQLELLDLFGRASPALSAYREKYRAWRELLAERDRITRETHLSPDQIDFLETQLAKLDSLELTEEAVENLERDFQRQSRAQELISLASALSEGLMGEDGATTRIAALVREARHLETLDPASKALADRLSSASLELADLGSEFEALGGEYQFDPEQAAELQARMDAWLDARRKHGNDVRAVIAARDDMRRRLEIQGDIEGSLARIEKQISDASRAMKKAAQALREVREKASKELAKVAAKSIAQLGFKKADFRVSITSLAEPGPTGDCGCEFLFSPNIGEPPLPLNRVASSGELARVMLALKTVLADLDEVPLLVFDEVDANVGGEIGKVVGEKMASIARNHQVLCVTHLPQVAAQAANHFVVTKDQSKNRTVVEIEPIHEDRKARVSELARMLGDRTAKSALAHAGELLGK
ncbi:DNA repair protein RecN (Recombination protein N) [Ereboglobus sp. PH5-10]|uniref:DNA repair protein RecN n=1 Tax=Ereboglobus sp. PH5-10 TaxID=2940629 RepID=UPI0024049334|nr:DNA repair protein RecN [Ereboglobus sp. PH5-10]MDF9826998.1 DNA repair protein RecN (Recombination protein N) [Ereboglobus sp. PH5-10]